MPHQWGGSDSVRQQPGWWRRLKFSAVCHSCVGEGRGLQQTQRRRWSDQITSRREQGGKGVIEAQTEERNADGAGGDRETELFTFSQGEMGIYKDWNGDVRQTGSVGRLNVTVSSGGWSCLPVQISVWRENRPCSEHHTGSGSLRWNHTHRDMVMGNIRNISSRWFKNVKRNSILAICRSGEKRWGSCVCIRHSYIIVRGWWDVQTSKDMLASFLATTKQDRRARTISECWPRAAPSTPFQRIFVSE